MNIRSERKCSDLDEAAARREAEIYLNEERMTLIPRELRTASRASATSG
jgi:hypothetical protein